MIEESSDVFTQLSWFRRDRVTAARVMVVGCGALGNEVLKCLAQFGIQHIVVVDFDHVEPANLTRSVFYTIDDAIDSRKKVDAILTSR